MRYDTSELVLRDNKMNIERILKNFEEHYNRDWGIRSSSKETRELLKQYRSIPLTLPITDESMKRVCEVLTRAGYQTSESCEGHNQEVPRVWFKCASQYYLRHLTGILSRESREKNFLWDLRTWTGEVFVNPDSPLFYMIEEVSTPDDDGGKRLRYLDNSLADDVIDVASVINCKKVRRFREIYLESEKVHLLRGRSFHQNGLVNMGVLIVFII